MKETVILLLFGKIIIVLYTQILFYSTILLLP